jgi:hypothetical protein
MRRRQQVAVSVMVAVAPFVGWFAFVPVAAGGAPPYDNTNDSVYCQTITKGKIKPKPLLVNGGTLPTVLSVSGTLGGCSSPSNANLVFPEGKSKFKGTIGANTNNCAGLAGPNTATGTLTITWSATENSDPNAPAPLLVKTSTVSVPVGGAVGNFAAEGGAPGGLYGTFLLGTPNGAAALSVAGAFQGGNAGATSAASVISTESVPTILGFCGGKGVKQVTVGVGSLILQ